MADEPRSFRLTCLGVQGQTGPFLVRHGICAGRLGKKAEGILIYFPTEACGAQLWVIKLDF